MFQFNQVVNTPKGPATYIARAFKTETDDEGKEIIVDLGVQVSRYVRMSELTQEERERARPSINDMDRETFAAWLKSAKKLRNEIYPLEQVTA